MLATSFNLNRYSPRVFTIWGLLAFQAGAINAGGFLACHRFVTHTTGFATSFGEEFAQGNFDTAFSMLTVPLFFLLGAMISGFLVDHQRLLGRQPKYNVIFGSVAIILFVVTWLGGRGTLGTFGLPIHISSELPMLTLLCLAAGMQNAAVTSASGAVVRTTHLTGITTDLGVGLVRVLSHLGLRKDLGQEVKANFMRVVIIANFIFGSTVGALLFFHAHFWGFLLPATTSLSLTIYSLVIEHRARRSPADSAEQQRVKAR
ncbi:MAG: DUF1275 domain-containing protein [Bdellovibrio sp.]|nr:MAG: DUF1275 domain-containing protein [Bdellovibrio sp.]